MRSFKKIALSVLLLIFIANMSAIVWRWARPYLLHDPLAGFPRVFLWAWERPETLAFLNVKEAGVAVLAKTLTLNQTSITTHPRMQPIELPPGVATMAVVRIESNSNVLPENARGEAVRQILDSATRSALGIQIDFDARISERSFYRALLADIRRQMPKGKILSITALVSWCLYDDWISDLPVDESVPMLFRLGIGKLEERLYLGPGNDFRAAKTHFSMGLSMDELPRSVPHGRRVYMFNPKPWTKESVKDALRIARELQ
jgi:hypothetical protein